MTTHKSPVGRLDDHPSLSINERVVWISDSGPEYGYVRWLGKLPDLGMEWMAGVEFDNPVGSGTGLYRDRQLFKTRLNHASLVPIIGLLKASDFDGPPEPPARSSSVRLIDFQDDDYHPQARQVDRQQYTSRSPLSHETKSPRSIKTSRSSNLPETQSSRERVIPIRLEALDPETISPSKSTAPKSSHKSLKKHDTVDHITSALLKTCLDQYQPNESSELLPPPALVVEANEKNPGQSLSNLLGKSRGIQGHNNSCYLDSTLFAMFSSTTIFDSLLYRPADPNDISHYKEIQRILRDDIVRPLRRDFIVNADQVMKLRTMLEKSSSVAGLTDEEKDPEEFLSLLLGQILRAEPYLKLSSGLESFFYQLIVDKDESIIIPTVQDLMEQSFLNSTVRLREIPPCLLLQMPRFGRQYKMYSRIMPSLTLDITSILEAVPRSCGHRGKDCDNLARYECQECFDEGPSHHKARLSSITYCNNCFLSKHYGKFHSTGIESHDSTKTSLKTPEEAISRFSNKLSNEKDKEIPKICMDLFAVLCIETSHYVCFVKCGLEPESPWCFFDSMADRRGEQHGYNIPEVSLFEEFSFWTSDKGVAYLLAHRDDKLLPDMARRLICDAYLCFYRYTGLDCYR